MTGTTAGGTTTRRQLVTFEAGGERFAADIFAVERVLRYEPPRILPSAAPWLRGVIAHGGRAIPVVDLRARLGLPAGDLPPGARILVVAAGDDRIGVLVDAVHAVRTVEADAIEPPPAVYRGLAREYLEGTVPDGEGLAVVLDTARLLTATERIEMERALAQGGRDG
jgi:purine-binding chemotaxis protein CheW